MSWLPQLGSNVLGNVIATLIVAVVVCFLSIGLSLPFVFWRRRRVFNFLGVSKGRPRFSVYFSTVFVQPGGSCDFRGTSRVFAGPALPVAELRVIQPVFDLFRNRTLDGISPCIRKWLGFRAHWSFSLITPQFSSSPQNPADVEFGGGLLTIGSQFYNSAADYFIRICDPFLILDNIGSNGRICVARGPRKGDVFQPRNGLQDDLAIVEKMYDPASQTTIFFAGGLGVVGTMGAVTYLTNNLDQLAKSYGKRRFALALRFQNVFTDPKAFTRSVELSRFSEE